MSRRSPLSATSDDAPTTVAGPSSAPSGVVMTPQGPMLRFESAVVEEVVTRVKRTTTSFAPIALPRIPAPTHLPLPTHLSSEGYPLAQEPTPDDMRFFTFEMDGRHVYVQEEGLDLSKGIPGQTCGPGWTRELPVLGEDCRPVTIDSFLAEPKTNKGKGKGKDPQEDTAQPLHRKRPHEWSRTSTSTGAKEAPMDGDQAAPGLDLPRGRSPPRKRARGGEMLSPDDFEVVSASSGSPRFTNEETSIVASEHPSIGGGLEAVTLMSLASMVEQFDKLPDKIQQHALMHMLRRSRMPTIQRITAFASTALRRDFIDLLPHEVALQILTKCDLKSLAAGMRVSKRWRRMIDSERSVWRARMVESGFTIGHGVEEAEEKSIKSRWEILDWQQRRQKRGRKKNRAGTPVEEEDMSIEPGLEPSVTEPRPVQDPDDRPSAVKHIFRRRYTSSRNWLERKPKHTTFPGHGVSVITCLQFDEDKIVSASDDHSINIYNTKTGQLRKRLDGHEGGVWALQYAGDTLVSGSTDRTVRIWDMDTLKPTHIFTGHTSTVRCLQIVEPVFDPATGEYQPAYPLIVTGSRDASLRVWRMPKKGESNIIPGSDHLTPPDDNPYHLQHLEGHSEAVRALAVHGRICVSGSYDKTVRVWDIVKGTCIHVLHGHEHKVYSIAFDPVRNRCASGAMDNTVRVWDLESGTCLHTLSGHTSLVGLLGWSTNHIVSAAADASVGVWDAETCELKHALTGHAAAITCFQHDEHKVVSGSDGALKLWDIRTGKPVRDLISGINSVWQVAFKDNLLVAASNRSGSTVFDVFDFGAVRDSYGVDDDRLDSFKRKPWERHNPHEPQTYQNDEIDADDHADADADHTHDSKTPERWRTPTGAPDSSPTRSDRRDRPAQYDGEPWQFQREQLARRELRHQKTLDALGVRETRSQTNQRLLASVSSIAAGPSAASPGPSRALSSMPVASSDGNDDHDDDGNDGNDSGSSLSMFAMPDEGDDDGDMMDVEE